jgi:hypothetical protein
MGCAGQAREPGGGGGRPCARRLGWRASGVLRLPPVRAPTASPFGHGRRLEQADHRDRVDLGCRMRGAGWGGGGAAVMPPCARAAASTRGSPATALAPPTLCAATPPATHVKLCGGLVADGVGHRDLAARGREEAGIPCLRWPRMVGLHLLAAPSLLGASCLLAPAAPRHSTHQALGGQRAEALPAAVALARGPRPRRDTLARLEARHTGADLGHDADAWARVGGGGGRGVTPLPRVKLKGPDRRTGPNNTRREPRALSRAAAVAAHRQSPAPPAGR